jgi:hypothetical protein
MNYTRNEWRTQGIADAALAEISNMNTNLNFLKDNIAKSKTAAGVASGAASGDIGDIQHTGGEKLHSKRVEKIENYTRNVWERCKNYT